MSNRYKICLMIVFIVTSIFAFQCPTNKECYCQIWKNSNWNAHMLCTINNNTIFDIFIQQNQTIRIECINSSSLSDFHLSMTLGTFKELHFANCDLPNNFKWIDIMQKLGAVGKNYDKLFLQSKTNLTLEIRHFEDFKNLKYLFIWSTNALYMDKDLLADLKELKNLQLIGKLQHLNAEFFDYTSQLDELYLRKNNLKLIIPSTFDKLKNLKNLDLAENYLTKLQSGIFDKLVALETLDVSWNNLVSLSKDVLAKLKHLNYLNLSNNSLTDLPRDLLRNNTKLIYVMLSNNQKNLTLPDGFFSNLTKLKVVELHNNGLVTLPENLFWGSASLQAINLNNNYLQFLHINIFRNLTELRRLSLNSNHLEDLPNNIFLNANRLQILDLSYNHITSISEQLLNGLYWLEELNITNNYLKTICEGSFKLLKKLNNVSLSNNRLEVLPNNIFSNTQQLQILDLSNNYITSISEHLFSELSSLKELNMKTNYLKIISEGSFRSLTKLEIVYLSDNHLEVLPDNIFSNTQQLKTLDLSNNRITAISEKLFSRLHRLNKLNMERNHLQTFFCGSFYDLPNLKIIDLSNNNLTIPKDDEHYVASPLYNLLEELYLANNSISKICNYWITHHPNLYILNLSYNNIFSIKTEDLLFSSDNIIVDLTHNKIQHIHLHDIKDYKTNHEIRVLLEHNPLNCDCGILYDLLRYNEGQMRNVQSHIQIDLRNSMCHTPKEMEKIRISDLYSTNLTCRIKNADSITVCPAKCECFTKPYDKTFIWDCSNKNLTSVPSNVKGADVSAIRTFTRLTDSILQFKLNFSHNMLMHMPNLKTMKLESVKELILSHNNISEISFDGLSTTLQVLELHNNNLSRIHPEVLKFWKNSNLTVLTLHENPWVCDCDTKELLNFTLTKYQILSDVSKIMCYKEKKSISEMTFIDFCPSDIIVIISISAAIATTSILIGLIFGLFYKYQTNIKIWLFAHQWCLWFVTEDVLDQNKLYDAFVSFSHRDINFVVDEMVPKLESGPTPFKLCLHYRDWLAGEFIPDNIVRSVENSRRTIVVLSRNFLESVWGRMEFRVAHCQALKEGRARVILILYDDIEPTDDLDSELKAYISMNTYIRWGDPWFWDKLKYALPHQSKRPRHSSVQTEVFEDYEL